MSKSIEREMNSILEYSDGLILGDVINESTSPYALFDMIDRLRERVFEMVLRLREAVKRNSITRSILDSCDNFRNSFAPRIEKISERIRSIADRDVSREASSRLDRIKRLFSNDFEGTMRHAHRLHDRIAEHNERKNKAMASRTMNRELANISRGEFY